MKAKSINGKSAKEIQSALQQSIAEGFSPMLAIVFISMAHDENEGLATVWNAPMAGFYTYGEFGRALNGKHEFHSTTCSWVALKEK